MAQDIKADWYTVVLLEGAIPPFSENTDKETVRKSLFQFGYHNGLTNIESVTVVKDNLRSGAVYKLYGDYEDVSKNIHVLYQLVISDSVRIKLSGSMTVAFSTAKDGYGHLTFREVDGGTAISGPPESVVAFCDLLNEKCARTILSEPRGASALSPSIQEGIADVPGSAKRIGKSLSTCEQSEYSDLSPDALSLLEKLPAGQIEGVYYDSRAGRVLFDKESPEKEDERITKFQNAYQAILAKKLKITEVEIPTTAPHDAVTKLIDTYNNLYDQCVFTMREGVVKIISNSSRQCDQSVHLLTKELHEMAGANKCEVIQLPGARTLTLKKADIVKEEVDIIVNPANERLSHGGGVAGVLDRASKGKLQRFSDMYIREKGVVPVGCIAITDGGGDLKCKKVIHAVGPNAMRIHKEADCKRYLKSVVNEALKGAEKYNARSIAFPAISTGIFGVRKELVARCLVDTILAYKVTKPHPVLSDIRIVIIDDPTYDPFALCFQQKQHEVKSPIKPAKFTPPKKPNSNPAATGEKERAAPSVVKTPDKKLKLGKDSAKIESLLKGLASDWKLLGTQLGFLTKALNKISTIPADVSVHFNQLLMKWLNGDTGSPATVSKLVNALAAMEGTEKYVESILNAFNAHPAASATPNSPSADTKDNDGATPTTPTDTSANISYSMDGSNVDKQDEETPLAPSSAERSQDEQHQQQSAAPGYTSTHEEVLRPQGTTPHTLATRSPYSGNFGTNQSGNSSTGMNYSGAVAGQPDTGAGAVTVQPQANTGHAGVSNSGTRDNGSQVKEEDKCPICLSGFKDSVRTKCGHDFCRGCIDQALQHNSFCPTCKAVLKTIVGNQPDGQMSVLGHYSTLPGYPNCRTIEIQYNIPSGIQGNEHPNPGQRFTGVRRVAYLPDNPEGREVFHLLQKAFDARLIFTVGTSITSGATNTVTWNDIHHKTNTHGGPDGYGYPDPGYLQRVKDDLAAKGIVP